MKFQVGKSANGRYIVICLTTGVVKGSSRYLIHAEELAYQLDKEARNKAERELLVAAGCYPTWCADDDN